MNSSLHKRPTLSGLKNSKIFTDCITGMSDGLIVPFALAAGMSVAFESSRTIVFAGLAAISAGSIAMALGGFHSNKSGLDQYQTGNKKEKEVYENLSQADINETTNFFADLNLGQAIQDQAAEDITGDKDRWVAFMRKYDLGDKGSGRKNAVRSALNIGLSYIAGGLVPLSPYFLLGSSMEALKGSIIMTLFCLFIFGYVKSRVNGNNPWKGAMLLVLFGALAATAAFYAAKLFVTI